ncbi:ABC transporter substrate-binding protein [Paenibacillus sp. JCM 10914]|uniref:ABC transporter substrate-binding protein n=1 Tax=Paenibacillus sp. JCM 10914 TaxID=1236974 RepID=UPI0003CC37E2|nr:extracellular solute-binding protein [Paenibacillus sp. JCM 10914]GAE07090.1 extracellular solute-binding protein, family 1 [Paenibacillus sp. JCM 10914]
MRKTTLLLFVLMFSLSVLLAACSGGGGATTADPKPGNEANVETPKQDDAQQEEATVPEEPVKDLSGELELWSFDPEMFPEAVEAFQAKYPKVKVNVVNMEKDEMHDKALTAIAAGTGGPDVLFLEGGYFKRFTSIEGLEDLLAAPYDAGQFQGEFTEANWKRWMSIDGKRLIGMPWDMPPAVTYYRADILEENGFPTDPAELMQYIMNSDNFMNMARTLKQKGVYLLEWRDQPVGLMNSGISFFDSDLNYRRNADGFVKGLDISKQIAQEELYLGQSIWSEEGQQAIKNGKLAFVYMGSWGDNIIESWAGEDQAGKWRATGLPFGAYGGQGGSVLSILSQSKNKELAWEFIKFNLASAEGQLVWTKKGIMPGWKPAWEFPEFKNVKDPYFGDQNTNQLYAALLDKVPASVETPLDDKASEVWGPGIAEVMEKNLDSKAALQKIEDDIMAAVAADRQKLLDARK